MMRTLEVVLVIAILLGALAVVSYFTVLPLPREVAPLNLRRLALTTLQTLDSDHDLSRAAFDVEQRYDLESSSSGALINAVPRHDL